MLSDNPKFKNIDTLSAPKTPEEMINFIDQLVRYEKAVSLSDIKESQKKEYSALYESEFLTELNDEKFELIYGTASILRDRILEQISDPNPHNWPMGYYRDAMSLIRLSDILDYGTEGDYLAECVLTIARNVIKYFESNPNPKINSDLMILESVSGLVNAFYEERVDSAEAIDCIAILDLLTAVKKQAIGFAMEPIQETDEVMETRSEVQSLYEGALEDAEAAKEYRIQNMGPEDLVLGGVELLHGTWMKVASNYANWLYRVDLKKGAQELAERILAIDATSPVAINVNINCMLDLNENFSEKELRLAETELNGLLEMLPKFLDSLYTIGRIKVQEGDFKGLGGIIQRLQIADPKNKLEYVQKLLEELGRGQYSELTSTPALH